MTTAARPAFAPWDVRTSSRILSPEESARRVRTFAAVESRLAEVLRSYAGVIESDHAKSILARHAKHHEWHASLFAGVVADAPGGDAAPAFDDEELAALLDAVAAPDTAGQAIEFLTGVYRVLIPRKITAYTYFVRALGGDAADSDERWFDLILKDEFAGIRDGELLLQSLLDGPEAVQRAADRRIELETTFVARGGLVGPDTLGAQTLTNRTEIAR